MIKNNTIPGNAKESIWNIIKRCTLTESEEIELYKYVKRKKINIFKHTFFKTSSRKTIQNGC